MIALQYFLRFLGGLVTETLLTKCASGRPSVHRARRIRDRLSERGRIRERAANFVTGTRIGDHAALGRDGRRGAAAIVLLHVVSRVLMLPLLAGRCRSIPADGGGIPRRRTRPAGYPCHHGRTASRPRTDQRTADIIPVSRHILRTRCRQSRAAGCAGHQTGGGPLRLGHREAHPSRDRLAIRNAPSAEAIATASPLEQALRKSLVLLLR